MLPPDDAPHFTNTLLQRPSTHGIDVVTILKHFAIVTYAVAPERVRPHVDDRFELDCFTAPDGTSRVWVSVVPFLDWDFHFARLPQLKFRFGQTNYRTYVIDRVTQHRAVWFFGTTLGGWPVVVPHYLWQLPWHYGRIKFDCVFDSAHARYSRYKMTTQSDWAAIDLELEDTGQPITQLDGFENMEAGLVRLTHPLMGVYYGRDGKLGSYNVWHNRLRCTVGQVRQARISLLDHLGIVPFGEQMAPHSVLIQPETEFIVQLPPKRFT